MSVTGKRDGVLPLFDRIRTFLSAMLGLPKHRREEKRIREQSLRYLEEAGLGHLAFEKAQNLPYGLQRKLEIARALATGPGMLLLDEPAAGMNPAEKNELADFHTPDTGKTRNYDFLDRARHEICHEHLRAHQSHPLRPVNRRRVAC